jgi:hypothetical protein
LDAGVLVQVGYEAGVERGLELVGVSYPGVAGLLGASEAVGNAPCDAEGHLQGVLVEDERREMVASGVVDVQVVHLDKGEGAGGGAVEDDGGQAEPGERGRVIGQAVERAAFVRGAIYAYPAAVVALQQSV